MRRLPDGRDALAMLERGALHEHHIDAIATLIAEFHARNGLGAPAPFPSEAWLSRVVAPVRESFGEVGRADAFAARARAAGAMAEAALVRHARRFGKEAEAIAGLVRSLLAGDPWWTNRSGERLRVGLDDIVIVAPAGADTIARLAQGRADDMVSLTVLATTAPVLIVPSMTCSAARPPIITAIWSSSSSSDSRYRSSLGICIV